MDRTYAYAFVVSAISAIIASAPWIFGFISSTVNPATIGNVGSIKAINIGVYWDSNCTDEVSTIMWGTLEPGSSRNVTVYVRNEGNTAVVLSLNTTNWVPANASKYMSLSWDYPGQRVNPKEVIQVTLKLSVSPEISGITTFSFDIVISGND